MRPSMPQEVRWLSFDKPTRPQGDGVRNEDEMNPVDSASDGARAGQLVDHGFLIPVWHGS